MVMPVWQEELQVQEPTFKRAEPESLAHMEHQKRQGQGDGLGAAG